VTVITCVTVFLTINFKNSPLTIRIKCINAYYNTTLLYTKYVVLCTIMNNKSSEKLIFLVIILYFINIKMILF